MLLHWAASIGLIALLAFWVASIEVSENSLGSNFCTWQFCLLNSRKDKLVLLIQWLLVVAIHGVLVRTNLPDYNLVTILVISAEILVGLFIYGLDKIICMSGGADDEENYVCESKPSMAVVLDDSGNREDAMKWIFMVVAIVLALLVVWQFPVVLLFFVTIYLIARFNKTQINQGWSVYDHFWVMHDAMFWPYYVKNSVVSFLIWAIGNWAIFALCYPHSMRAVYVLYVIQGIWAYLINGWARGTESLPKGFEQIDEEST